MKYRKKLMSEAWLVLARYQCRTPSRGKMIARHNLRRRIKQITALDTTGNIKDWLNIDLNLPDEKFREYLLMLDGILLPDLII
jgi:hypothetical protein